MPGHLPQGLSVFPVLLVNFVTPAKAGAWIPVFTGMTGESLKIERLCSPTSLDQAKQAYATINEGLSVVVSK